MTHYFMKWHTQTRQWSIELVAKLCVWFLLKFHQLVFPYGKDWNGSKQKNKHQILFRLARSYPPVRTSHRALVRWTNYHKKWWHDTFHVQSCNQSAAFFHGMTRSGPIGKSWESICCRCCHGSWGTDVSPSTIEVCCFLHPDPPRSGWWYTYPSEKY